MDPASPSVDWIHVTTSCFGWLPDRVGPKRLLFPSLVTLAVGFLALAGADDERAVLLAGALCGAGHGYTFPLLFGMVVNRARKVQRFFSQPFSVAEEFTGVDGEYVSIEETIKGFREILDGKHDDIPEQAFFMCGGIDGVLKKAKEL